MFIQWFGKEGVPASFDALTVLPTCSCLAIINHPQPMIMIKGFGTKPHISFACSWTKGSCTISAERKEAPILY